MVRLGDRSSPEAADLTKEEFGFHRKENFFSFNHKDWMGLFLLILIVLTIIELSIGNWLCVLGFLAILVGFIAQEPIRAIYIVSVFFSLGLRTPEFLPQDTQFPQHKLFKDPVRFAKLQTEVKAYLAETNCGKELIATKDTYEGENEYIGSGGNGKNQWRIKTIKVVGIYANRAAEKFPTLVELLEECPDIIACVLSVLEPKCKIPMHVGYYKGLMRFMVPLIIPKDRDNTWLNVNGTKFYFQEGSTVLWDDSFPHAAYNNTDEVRVIFYMDVLRTHEIPWVARALNHGVVALFKASGIAQKEIARTEVVLKLD